ncbi:hypothetical protein H257_11164 [Aphanomyces astaci]|uniref:Uncharacterized protein n=1 Tax=Aphanomyces astaci TaxID=112090 RepID=W4G4K3_APHAT|nr:hypothetical protein, variant [Aphanomyces astaci]XP_009836317.1 hypothetical protein H257_11164 [Aphanomyces astaci]ETV74210.1 hypothetical protein H257_11164 [Aphanomyces astaci]ETV74211.1 hypothetical protein, variant [Aphanomyces astaci]|eukprot:XP_009836316.1 hypothetical protein, variant [Aphanomyces astaci]
MKPAEETLDIQACRITLSRSFSLHIMAQTTESPVQLMSRPNLDHHLYSSMSATLHDDALSPHRVSTDFALDFGCRDRLTVMMEVVPSPPPLDTSRRCMLLVILLLSSQLKCMEELFPPPPSNHPRPHSGPTCI